MTFGFTGLGSENILCKSLRFEICKSLFGSIREQFSHCFYGLRKQKTKTNYRQILCSQQDVF